MLDVCRTLHASLYYYFYYYFRVCSYLLSYDEIKKMYIYIINEAKKNIDN